MEDRIFPGYWPSAENLTGATVHVYDEWMILHGGPTNMGLIHVTVEENYIVEDH